MVENVDSFNTDAKITGGSKTQPNLFNDLKLSIGNVVPSEPNRTDLLKRSEKDYTCFKCGKCLTYRISQPTVQDIQNREALSARPEREMNFVTSLRSGHMVDQINSCLRDFRAPYCTREFSSKRRYVIPCKDIHSLLRLLCSYLNGRCYVRLDEMLIRKSLQCDIDRMLDIVIKNVRVCQERYDILIDVALAYYIAAIKNFKFLADDKDLAGMAASAAANTASLGIESAVQVVGNVAAGAAISAIMDVAISTATIYIAKRKKDEGIISDKEFNTKIKKTVCQSSLKFVGGTAGSVIGQAFIPVPVVGALVGGLCGSLIGTGIGIGINYGVFDRLEKNTEERENDAGQKDCKKPKENSLYEKLSAKRVAKTTIYKEREKNFEELVFPLELPKKTLATDPNSNLSKSPKKEIFSFLKKKQLALEHHNEPEPSVLVLRRLKRNKALSVKTDNKVTVSKQVSTNENNEVVIEKNENKPQRTFLESFRRKSPSLVSHSDEENIPPKSEDNENESVMKNHVQVNRHETASRVRSLPLEQINSNKNERKNSYGKNRSDTLPETRKFGFNFNFKDSFRSLSFATNENEKTLDENDIDVNDETKEKSKPTLERVPPVEEQDDEESVESRQSSFENSARSSISIETDDGSHLGEAQSFDNSSNTEGVSDSAEGDSSSHAEHSDSATSDVDQRSPSPSMFKNINLNTFRRSFHSMSISTNDLRHPRKPVLTEQKSDTTNLKSDKSENINKRRPFKRANTENNIRINVKYASLGKLTPGFTQSIDENNSQDAPNTNKFLDSCRLHVEQKRMDLAERKKRAVSAGEEKMSQYAKDHYMSRNINKEPPKRERKRSNSTPHMHTVELTDKVKNIINEQKQKIENEIFTTNVDEGRKSTFSNVKNFFDSFGKSGKKV